MTAILEALAGVWPFLLAALGVVYGLVARYKAKVDTARAEKAAAQAEAKAASSAKVESEANAAAAQAGADAVKERTHVENEIAARPDGESARRLRDEWSRD